MGAADDPPSSPSKLDEAVARAARRAIEQLDEEEREKAAQQEKLEVERSGSSKQRDA